jgi:AraC family transcriptional regulator
MPLQKTITNNKRFEKVISKSIFESDFYQVKHWSYDLLTDKQTMTGFNDCHCMVYIKRGSFLFNLSRKEHDIHSGYILLEKPDCDYKMRPSAGECTIFNFTDDFYNQFITEMNLKQVLFFTNKNLLSVVLQSTPATDYLHHQILNRFNNAGKLEMDNLVLELFSQAAGIISNFSQEEDASPLSKANQLNAVELAKEYMNNNFINDISLQDVSSNSFVSPFHFSRLFKKTTSFSPHQYLQQVRLKHAEMLLKNSGMPVVDIAYAAGFSSTAYFATAFKQKYKMNPLQYRKLNLY